MISFKLTKNDEIIVYLTDNTIKKLNIVCANAHKTSLVQKTNDIELFLEMENINLITEAEIKIQEESLPREVDSVRELFDYSLAAYNERCYLDGELEVTDGFTQSVSKYEYKDLFALQFQEKYVKDTKNTVIYVLLREKVR